MTRSWIRGTARYDDHSYHFIRPGNRVWSIALSYARQSFMGRATWVAVILALIGTLVLVTGPQAAIIGPAVLIGLGLFLLAHACWPRLRAVKTLRGLNSRLINCR